MQNVNIHVQQDDAEVTIDVDVDETQIIRFKNGINEVIQRAANAAQGFFDDVDNPEE